MQKKDIIRYILAFFITTALFGSMIWLSSYLNKMKLTNIKNVSNKISIDILSSETQFALLEELSCQDVDNSILSQEIADLAGKITYSEQNVGNQEEVQLLKKQYTILQVKDFLLSKRIRERCGEKTNTIFYFYSNNNSCIDCEKQGYVLDAVRQKYPDVRVYAFDYNLDLSTIRALISIYKIKGTLPELVINGKTVSGFKTVEDLEKLLPKELTAPAKKVIKI